MSQISSKQLFWLDNNVDPTLAVVNSGTAYFVTDFLLGDQMTLEVCFKKTSTVRTGALFVGIGGTGGNDYLYDFRFFFAPNPNRMYCDCGKGNPQGDAGGRYYAVDELTQWHVVKFPTLVNGQPVAILDGVAITKNRNYTSDGAWGTKPSKLKLFGVTSTDTTYQPGAIRYINVWQYNTDNLLASFWPDKKGGFVDTVSKKFYAPVQGEVEIKKWEEV